MEAFVQTASRDRAAWSSTGWGSTSLVPQVTWLLDCGNGVYDGGVVGDPSAARARSATVEAATWTRPTNWSATSQAISCPTGGRPNVGRSVAPLGDSVCDHVSIEPGFYDPKSPSTHAITALTSPSTVPQAMKSRPS